MTEDTRWFASNVTAPPTVQDLRDMIVQRERLFDYIVTGPADIDLVILRLTRDAAKGVEPELVESFCQSMLALNEYDFFLLDIPGGLTQTALTCCLAPCDCLLLVTPEDHVLAQSLKLLDILSANGFHDPLKLVVTKSDGSVAPEDTYNFLQETAAEKLNIPLEYWGAVNQIVRGEMEVSNLPFLLMLESENRKYFERLAMVLDDRNGTFHGKLTPTVFWTQMIDLLSYPLQMPSSEYLDEDNADPDNLEHSINDVDFYSVLQSISDNLSTIGGELIQMRKLFEQILPEGENEEPDEDTIQKTQEIIPLDIEAYAANRKKYQSED
jgi:MinD-like ATPase involved in chromosome partitioning or flagellar assembly